ncbi:putative redox protein, regulator of disulfide bond formation [Corynebacterium mustelae]|uniref:Putative redox protein, regulator of disulfide bond formation n=1 Tax=Corynebacterium mustelae TaxID=571915 RepID=A0A0G3H3P5_9CORY|nr:YeeE/YedE thiosulfate transporter family protein [Corynebacterium mustelae]AKK05707.1 putative redox protein, regulator of disulfide bond formation [Corynebacterium mustelae]
MIITGLIVGIVLGAIMQRGRFCVTGMLRDIFLAKTWRSIVALLIVITVHAVGLHALDTAGVISLSVDSFAPVAVVIGGLIFGCGIVLAGGCASGTWYRSGEGLVGSWVALVAYATTAAAMKTGVLSGFNNWLRGYTIEATTIPETLGISSWYFIAALIAVTAYAVAYYRKRDAGTAKVDLHVQGWRRPLHQYVAGALIGVIGVLAWPLSAATGRDYGLGITGPSANLTNFVVTGDTQYFDWGVLLVVGILFGSFAAARATGEFRVRIPEPETAVRALAGGILMGIGASLAGGCTVGNGMVETSLFSYQGWIGLLAIAIGVGAASKIWLKPTAKSARPQPAAGGHLDGELFDRLKAFQTSPVALKLPAPSAVGVREIAPGTYTLDAVGSVCPFPLIDAKEAIAHLQIGEKLVIDFDCTQATDSIPQWAADQGHEVENFHQTGVAEWQLTVVKGAT